MENTWYLHCLDGIYKAHSTKSTSLGGLQLGQLPCGPGHKIIIYINLLVGGLYWKEAAKNSRFDFRHFSYDILYTTCYSHYINLFGKHKYILVSAKKIGSFDRDYFSSLINLHKSKWKYPTLWIFYYNKTLRMG